ncbi:BolA family protein [Derxia gummosa]|uniref:BolA family protein n=1 Tax=Derxia gummosa DSM 723 TaxID=1121388 RepID=A0A9U5CWU4_9BURK|nr:BolA family protein [Derxia gummosa]
MSTAQMMTKEAIQEMITKGLNCSSIQVFGDDGAHFDAVVVSPEFEGKSRVQRHQLVYKAIGDGMREAIHALGLKTLTPAEQEAGK